jgi:CrcB protein
VEGERVTPPLDRFLLICLGGALGSGARYLVSLAAVRLLGAEFPFGTLMVNLVGSFGIGFVQHLGAAAVVPEGLRLFLVVGIAGGLTTYSAFSYETIRLLEVGAWTRAWVNVVVTTAACLALCLLGLATARWLLR